MRDPVTASTYDLVDDVSIVIVVVGSSVLTMSAYDLPGVRPGFLIVMGDLGFGVFRVRILCP